MKKKKRKAKPFQEIRVETRLHEIFDGKVCHVCGAPAERLRPYETLTLPDPLIPQNYFCNQCFYGAGGPDLKPGKTCIPLSLYFPVPGEEGSEPFLFSEGAEERERLHTEVYGCAYGEYPDPPIKPTESYRFNTSWAERRELKRKRNLARQCERMKEKRRLERQRIQEREAFLLSMPKVPTGTGLYVQVGNITFPWRVYHDS